MMNDDIAESVGGLTTRGMKRRKIDDELNLCVERESFVDESLQVTEQGGSSLKYEIVNKT